MNFKLWLESTLDDLYQSAVAAYPRTAYRQHSTDPVKIVRMSIIPFKGLHTVFFKGIAENRGRNYTTSILFKKVDFDPKGIQIKADDGEVFNLKPVSLTENEVLVRCNCPDFHWRFAHYNHEDGSLFGRDRKKYEGNYPANPKEMPGMCKHLMSMVKSLRDSYILREETE